jgi:hypothetical protein
MLYCNMVHHPSLAPLVVKAFLSPPYSAAPLIRPKRPRQWKPAASRRKASRMESSHKLGSHQQRGSASGRYRLMSLELLRGTSLGPRYHHPS